MRSYLVVFVLLSLLLVFKEAAITEPPSSVSALIYTLANFTCESTGNILTWTVRGHLFSDPSNQYREISVTTNNISVGVWSSVLTIRALPINDGISVGCLVVSGSGDNIDLDQKGATLTVKGTTQVKNPWFAFNVFNSLSWLIWSPPLFSSENTPISYHIYIMNQHGQLLYNDITNDTSYELYNLTVCDIYTATVIVMVSDSWLLYTSNKVTTHDEYCGDYNLSLHNHTVLFDNSVNKFKVTFIITVEGYPKVCNSTLRGTIRKKSSLLNELEMEHTPKHIPFSNSKTITVNYTVSYLIPLMNCVFIEHVFNNVNVLKSKEKSFFTTYHVQELTLQYYSDNGSVVVKCRFAERSTADGCHVIFRESSKETVKSINMSKSSIESTVYQYISLPVSGNYTVTSHDIVDGTIITNPSVVYPQVLEYTLILPSPTVNGYMTVRASTITIVVSALIAVILVVQESNVLVGHKLKPAHVSKDLDVAKNSQDNNNYEDLAGLVNFTSDSCNKKLSEVPPLDVDADTVPVCDVNVVTVPPFNFEADKKKKLFPHLHCCDHLSFECVLYNIIVVGYYTFNVSFMGKAKTFVNQETSKDLHNNDWTYIYNIGGRSQFYDLFDGGGVKMREKIVGSSNIGGEKIVVVAHYDKKKVFKKKIDLHQKNAQLLSTLHEFHENFILVDKSCAFKFEMFLSLICDERTSSYFIPVVLPYCQLIDRDKPVFTKSCDPVIIVFKSNTVVSQEHIHDDVLFLGFAMKDGAGQCIVQCQMDKDTLYFTMTDDNEIFKRDDTMVGLVALSDESLGDSYSQIDPAFRVGFIQWINEDNEGNESTLIEAPNV